MGWIVVVIILVLAVILVITNNSSGNSAPKKDEYGDYMDNKIMNQTLGENNSLKRQQELKKVEKSPVKVNIEKYHESNEVLGAIRQEYIRKYHEYEGPVYYVDPLDMDNYITRFSVTLWNSELDTEKKIVGSTLENLVSQCETQFKIWADKVEKKTSPEGIERRLQANRKYLSENKKKLKELDTAATYKQHNALLNKMQLRYNEIISSGNTFKESQLQELKELGIKVDSIENPKSALPDMIFEVKGLFYRSAQAQLVATLLEVGDELFLQEEPDNEVDASAVKVLTSSGECIGYVDKEHCVSVGALINLIDSCRVIKRSNHQIPYITAKISFKE